jgi:hypothetical protein
MADLSQEDGVSRNLDGPIRNKLSHSRFLSEKEYQKLSFQAEDLFKLLLATDRFEAPMENPYAA